LLNILTYILYTFMHTYISLQGIVVDTTYKIYTQNWIYKIIPNNFFN
jgi:hypothetical protein